MKRKAENPKSAEIKQMIQDLERDIADVDLQQREAMRQFDEQKAALNKRIADFRDRLNGDGH